MAAQPEERPNARTIRFTLQMIMLALALLMTLNHELLLKGGGYGWFSSAYLHYVCPICGVTTVYQFFASSTPWIEKLHSQVAIVLGLVTISCVVLGPVFCGWICPFGGYQDLLSKVGRRLFKRRYNRLLPAGVDASLKWLRPVSLISVLMLTYSGSVLFLEEVNPYHSLLGLLTGAATGTGLILLGLISAASLAVQRPWCRYLCPYGSLLGFFNRLKPFRIVRDNASCIHCRKCDTDCPMGIRVEKETEVRSLHCISCLDCTDSCPKSKRGTLQFHARETEETTLWVKIPPTK